MPNEPSAPLTLKELDELFNQIWLNTRQLPILLSHWQQSVSDHIQTLDAGSEEVNALLDKLDGWQEILLQNRVLLEQHQDELKLDLVTGERSLFKEKVSKIYQEKP